MKLSKKILLITLSVLILAGGFFVFIKWQKVKNLVQDISGSKKAGAGVVTDKHYHSDWTMTSCRVLRGSFPMLATERLFLGPASWQVTTTIGSDTIIENWNVPEKPGDLGWTGTSGWKQTLGLIPPQGLNSLETITGTCDSNNFILLSGSWAEGLSTNGLYGFIFMYDRDYGRTSGGASIPTHWHVKGTLP